MERQAMTRAPLRARKPMDFAVSRLPPRHQQYQKRRTLSYKDFWLIVAFQGAKMRQKSGPVKEPAEQVVKDIRRILSGSRQSIHFRAGNWCAALQRHGFERSLTYSAVLLSSI